MMPLDMEDPSVSGEIALFTEAVEKVRGAMFLKVQTEGRGWCSCCDATKPRRALAAIGVFIKDEPASNGKRR